MATQRRFNGSGDVMSGAPSGRRRGPSIKIGRFVGACEEGRYAQPRNVTSGSIAIAIGFFVQRADLWATGVDADRRRQFEISP